MEGTRNRGSFRLQAKGWFLTYPKCTMTKEDVLGALKLKRTGLQQVIVSRELHHDGTPHLHCYLYYSTKFDCTNERFFDLADHHPNIQVAKSIRAVQHYIKKDGDFIQEGINYHAELHAIQDHRSVLGKRLIAGESLTDLAQEYPQIIFGFKKLYEDVSFYRSHTTPTLPRCTGFIPNPFGLITPLLCTKQQHYWFWSASPNKGKTTWLKSIQEKHPSLWYSWQEKYQDPRPNVQFVLLDEYSIGHLTVTQLNMMCDGTYLYPVKGSSPFQLSQATILICGNTSPLEVYQEKHHELLKARFNIHCLDTN